MIIEIVQFGQEKIHEWFASNTTELEQQTVAAHQYVTLPTPPTTTQRLCPVMHGFFADSVFFRSEFISMSFLVLSVCSRYTHGVS